MISFSLRVLYAFRSWRLHSIIVTDENTAMVFFKHEFTAVRRARCGVAVFVVLAATSPAVTFSAQPLEFTRMVAHWSDYADPGYLRFIDEAQPELVQVGF